MATTKANPGTKPNCGCPADRPCAFEGFGHTNHAVRPEKGSRLANDSASLAAAVKALGAVEVTTRIDGDDNDKALYAMTWGRRWYVTDAEVVKLTHLLGGGEMIAHLPVVLPPWWSPERRFAVLGESFASLRDAEDAADTVAPRPSVTTASLETGEEIPA